MVAGKQSYSDEYIRDILKDTKTIAMVGASNNPERPSNRVMQYLLAAGFRVIPVNPGIGAEGLFGQTAYASLKDIPDQVDMVDIFRRSDAVAGIVDELLPIIESKGVRYLWLQLGVIDEESAVRARDAGLDVIMDRCLKIEHKRLDAGSQI
jgi:predicted CoA-binding protein